MILSNQWYFFSIFFLFIAFFFIFLLNFISSIYSEVDLFNFDIAVEQKKLKNKKFFFVLKNNHFIFISVIFFQMIINSLISILFFDKIQENLFSKKSKFFFVIILNIIVTISTEIFPKIIGTKKISKKLIKNDFFINFSYLLVKISYFFLSKIIKPKERFFINSEKDVMLFIKNLATENILEKKESDLINSAFIFDEMKVKNILIEKKNVVYLHENMNYNDIKKIYSKFYFSRYPVINSKKEIIGVFSLKRYYWKKIINKKINWKKEIYKENIFVFFEDNLDKVFEKMQKNFCHLSIVKKNKNFIGIITFQDIINILLGKMKDEKEVDKYEKKI